MVLLMFQKPRNLNPLIRLLSALQLANLAVIAIKLYAMFSGAWVIDSASWATLSLNIFILLGLIWIQVMANARIHAIIETAHRIIRTGDMSQRVPDVYGGSEELSLPTVLNQMLDEIENAMQSIRTVSDNIAHDLRHPLTRLRNHVEQLLETMTRDKADETHRLQVAELIGECDQLLSTFQAILRISNIEKARRHGGFREVRLHQLMHDVIELYEPCAAQHQVTIAFDAIPCTTVGDKDLLFQAFTNLLDNALKYTPEGGHIDVEVGPGEDGVRIRIRDTGPGIPDAHKPNVFRRFYRVDQSRSTPGTGLGLSLVGAVVKLHQGKITLSDNEPHGLSVEIKL